MSLLGRMDSTCQIERSTPTRSSEGEVTNSWAVQDSQTAVPCQLEAIKVVNGQKSFGKSMEGTHKLIVPYGTDIEPERVDGGLGDRVKIGGVYYAVLSVEDPAQRHKHLVCELRRTS